MDDPVLNAINKFKNHPNIIMIKRKINTCEFFAQYFCENIN